MSENESINSVHVVNPIKDMVNDWVQHLAQREAERLEAEATKLVSAGVRAADMVITVQHGKATVTWRGKSTGRKMAEALRQNIAARETTNTPSSYILITCQQFEDDVADAIDTAIATENGRCRRLLKCNALPYNIPNSLQAPHERSIYGTGFEAGLTYARAALAWDQRPSGE